MNLESKLEEIYTDDAQLVRISTEIGESIQKNEVTLVSLVEGLGPKLTHKDAMERGRGMNILSVVFNTLSSSDCLGEKELAFIVEFLHDRLRDQHMIIPKVIHCIKSIIGCKNLPKGAAGKLILQLFKEANIQSHIHKDRHAFFLILATVLELHIDELKSWESDFFMNLIQSIDGEKDPRNLLLIFQLVPIALNNFPVGPFVDELFEVISCYFPVDFTPVSADPNEAKINREMLATALNSCLSHSNLFASLLVPLILEKLDSTLTTAKLDSLKLLAMCCERSYLPEDLEPYLPAAWRLLRKEVFMGGNETVNSEAFSLITSTFSMLSRSSKILSNAINMIFTECRSHLMEPELRLMVPSSSVLIAIAEASECSYELLMSLLLPVLYEQFLKKTSLTERQNILSFLIKLVSINRSFPLVNLMTVISNWDEIVATMFNIISHSDVVFVNLSLEFFTLILPKLDSNSLEILQQHLLTLLSAEKALPSEETKSRLFRCLEYASICFPSEINKTTIPSLLERTDNLKNSDSKERFDLNLLALAECSFVLPVAQVVAPVLLERIQRPFPQENSSGDNLLILTCMKRLLSYVNCYNRILHKCCDTGEGKESKRTPKDVLEFCEYLCTSVDSMDVLVTLVKVVRSSTTLANRSEDELLRVRELVYLSTNDSIRKLLRSSSDIIQLKVIDLFWNSPLDDKGESVQQFVIDVPGLLLESVLGSIRRSVRITKAVNLLTEILRLVLQPSSISNVLPEEFQQYDLNALFRLFANIVNKLESDPDLGKIETKVATLLNKLIGQDVLTKSINGLCIESDHENLDLVSSNAVSEKNLADDAAVSTNFLHLILWLVKALAMRGNSSVDRWLEICVQLMGLPTVGNIVAENFNIIMEDCPFTVNVESHCLYRFLYKQRVFLTSVPKLVQAYKAAAADHPTRVNYIRTLSCLLLHVPRTVLLMELDNVLPLLIASLICETSSTAVRLSSLKALDDLLVNSSIGTDSVSPLSEYFHDLVPYLVQLTTYKPDMNIRILSLKCLQKCAKYPVHMVLKEKSLVEEHLKDALDDPKRFVRKEAVTTRNIWILTGAPGGL